MNNIREINRINERELELAVSGGAGSWHDEYKDSAYIFVGGLPLQLTEGDIITIFSQYGEVMDINLPREKDTGKKRGFGFIMYEDQRSTVLAVDNLNGAKILERILRVDHVRSYKQPKEKGEDGDMVEREEQSLNAAPKMVEDESEEEEEDLDLEDPMASYLVSQRKSGSSKDPEKARRKEEKRRKKEERALKRQMKEERRDRHDGRSASDGRHRRRSQSPDRGHSHRHREEGERERSRDPRHERSEKSHRSDDRDRHGDRDRWSPPPPRTRSRSPRPRDRTQ